MGAINKCRTLDTPKFKNTHWNHVFEAHPMSSPVDFIRAVKSGVTEKSWANLTKADGTFSVGVRVRLLKSQNYGDRVGYVGYITYAENGQFTSLFGGDAYVPCTEDELELVPVLPRIYYTVVGDRVVVTESGKRATVVDVYPDTTQVNVKHDGDDTVWIYRYHQLHMYDDHVSSLNDVPTINI